MRLFGTSKRRRRKRRKRQRWSSTDARTDARSDGEGKLCRDSNAHVGAAESNWGVAVERFEKVCWNLKEGRMKAKKRIASLVRFCVNRPSDSNSAQMDHP